MVKVKTVKEHFLGSRYHMLDDPPYEVDDHIADRLLKAGLVKRYVPTATSLTEPEAVVRTDPAPAHAEHAVSPVQRKRG